MDFAAAALRAVARMTPDRTWTPPVGVLFMRILQAPWVNEIVFGYADDPPKDGLSHYRSIARIRDWCGEPDFGSGLDCARGDISTTPSGGMVVRRLATPDDIRALVKLWDHYVTLDEWRREVKALRGLDDESKAMVLAAMEETCASATTP